MSYMVERLNYRPEELQWSLLPAYKDHTWDGTIDPLKTALTALDNWEWVAIKGAKGTGKTRLAAGIVYQFIESYENSLVITTAPKQEQLELHIWKEMSVMYSLFNRGELSTTKLRMIPGSNNWIADAFVAGVKASDALLSATRAHGFHAEHMLIIFEETPGINPSVINAFIETCGAPHNLILALGNPNHQLDELAKLCKMPNVREITMSALDHPNVVLDDPNFIPGAVSRVSIERLKKKYGEKSPFYISRVRGLVPKQAEDALIKLEWVEQAIARAQEPVDADLFALGVDVANSEDGDQAAIAQGKGNVLLEVNAFTCPNSNDLGHKVRVKMLNDGIDPENVGVDGVGVGAGTVNTLKEYGIEVQNIQGGQIEISGQEERFPDMRSQVWWRLREDLRLGRITLPDDDELKLDLITPKYTIQSGRIVVESKLTFKKRISRSPNKGDAVAYWNWVREARDYNQYGYGFMTNGGNDPNQKGEQVEDDD